MSRKHRQQPTPIHPPIVHAEPEIVAPMPEVIDVRKEIVDGIKKEPRREVVKHRQCPLCYTGEFNGVGVAYNTNGRKRYYKCDRCRYTWIAYVETTVFSIEHKNIT